MARNRFLPAKILTLAATAGTMAGVWLVARSDPPAQADIEPATIDASSPASPQAPLPNAQVPAQTHTRTRSS